MTLIALSATAALFVMLLMGMPVAFAMLLSGAVGLYFAGGFYPLYGILSHAPYEHVASYTLSTLPMFILMGAFLTASSFTRDLFNASNQWLGHIRGGIAYAAVAGGVLLAAISGSSTAAASTLASAAYPEMRRYGYNDSFSSALIAVVGTLAAMVPPSIGLILYGIFTETSIAALLMAALIPGLLTAIGYVLTILYVMRRRPETAPAVAPRVAMLERMRGLTMVWPVLLLMLFMLGGIYSGAITPTEIGAVGALLALILGIAMRRIDMKGFVHAVLSAVQGSVMILTIIGTAAVFGVFLTMTGVTQDLLYWIEAAGVNRYVVLLTVMLLVLVLGFFLDQLAILILTLPLYFPLLMGLGFDPVWLGILVIKTGEIGMLTPPMGLNVFVVSGTTGLPASTVFRGIWPFVVMELILLLILLLFPALSLYLPGLH